MTIVSSFVLHSMQVLIRFKDSKMTVFVHTRMSSKLPYQKMADTSKDELPLGGGIRHITVHRCTTCTVNKFLLA